MKGLKRNPITDTIIQIVDEQGNLLSRRNSEEYNNHSHPVDYIPQIGSTIVYKTFRKQETAKGIKDFEWKVIDIQFVVEESWNGTYDKLVSIVVEESE